MQHRTHFKWHWNHTEQTTVKYAEPNPPHTQQTTLTLHRNSPDIRPTSQLINFPDKSILHWHYLQQPTLIPLKNLFWKHADQTSPQNKSHTVNSHTSLCFSTPDNVNIFNTLATHSFSKSHRAVIFTSNSNNLDSAQRKIYMLVSSWQMIDLFFFYGCLTIYRRTIFSRKYK